MRDLLLAVAALSTIVACDLQDSEIDSSSDELKRCNSKTGCLTYEEWEGNGERLFAKRTRAPMAVLMGAGDATTIMFGFDAATGAAQFAYFAPSEAFTEMTGAASREASVQIMFGADVGRPPILGGPPIGPSGGDFVPAGVLRPTANFAFSVNQAQQQFNEDFFVER